MLTKLITKKGQDNRQETPKGKNKTQPYSEIQQVKVTWKDRIKQPTHSKRKKEKKKERKKNQPYPMLFKISSNEIFALKQMK